MQNSLLNASSLRLHVTLKSKKVNIHGQSAFDIFADPVLFADNTSVLYDGFSAFTQGDTQFTYTFVNGTSYITESSTRVVTSAVTQTVRCLPSILPFESILPALNNASAIPSATVGGEPVVCPDGTLFQTSFSGLNFALCASGTSGFVAYGLDFTVAVEYLSSPLHNISVPTLTETNGVCEIVATPKTVTPTALALLTGQPMPPSSSRSLREAAPAVIEADSCEYKSTPRPCIFFHGLGNPNEELQDTPKLTKHKFGDISGHAPCCTTTKYAVLNTVDYGWTNDTLQQKFCDFSLSMSDTSDMETAVIEDTIVVTHSMGGLVMSMALATGKCRFSETTTWVSLSAPMTGSMAGDYIQDWCDDELTSIGTDLLDLIGSVLRLQPGSQFPMCSNYYDGVVSIYQPSCIIGGEVIPHKSKENDGLVEFQSCLGGLDPNLFGDSYEYRFYMPELNHADTAFLTHDGWFKDSQKPFKWFECLFTRPKLDNTSITIPAFDPINLIAGSQGIWNHPYYRPLDASSSKNSDHISAKLLPSIAVGSIVAPSLLPSPGATRPINEEKRPPPPLPSIGYPIPTRRFCSSVKLYQQLTAGCKKIPQATKNKTAGDPPSFEP
ncbi:unnamed protein product [Phytophthora lilii]|uniref:Unnamed protein product n=1 Tax=Phytophthora lilii TaxID=2077276 RepID=A0A9W6XBE5_9STRA|nr:unnamed protein product [Phytophthora lilii]